jgi:signal transduction histidine kinase
LLIFLLSCSRLLSNERDHIYIFVDSNSTASLENADNFPWKEIKQGENISLSYNENSTVWCKLIGSKATFDKGFIWTFTNIHLDSISCYQNKQLHSIQGDRTKGKSEYLNAYTIRPIYWNGTTSECIVKVKKQLSFLDLSIALQKEETLSIETENSIALYYAFIGFAFVLLSLNGYIYWQTKSKINLYYIAYALIGMIYVSVNMGIAKYALFPDFLYFSEFRIFSGCYWFLFLGIFITKMLEIQLYSPRIYKSIMFFPWIEAGLTVFAFICLYFKAYALLIIPSYLAYLIFFVNILFLGIGVYKAYRIKHRRVKYITLSFAPHILWSLNMILNAFGIIDIQLSKNWISIIILYEMLLFGWILIKDYVDSFKHVQLLQEKIINEEKLAIIRIDQTRIQERRFMAEILHDKVGIDIARSMHLLELGKYAEVKASILELGSYIRNLSHRILPSSLEMGALNASLREQIEKMNTEYNGVSIRYASFDFPEIIPQEQAFCLYLTALELIHNALKHSHATSITVELYYYPEKIILSCTDDGKGTNGGFQFGFGLSSIQRRLIDLSGDLHVNSDSETGTCILAELPH